LIKKLISVCTDGASNYMGVHAGVQQQLRDKLSPVIVGVHCMCHRTALVMNDAGSHEILSLVDSLISGVHSIFNRNHKG